MLPSVEHRHNTLTPHKSNTRESSKRHIKMMMRRITPPSIIIRRAEVGSRHRDRSSRKAPSRIGSSVAGDLKASTASLALSKQGCAQRCSVYPETRVKCVVIATSPSWYKFSDNIYCQSNSKSLALIISEVNILRRINCR